MDQPLAGLLKKLREVKGVSLRKMEEDTNISNPYLSQLENGKIEAPSPHVLYKLAQYYKIPYELVMEAAGYIKPESGDSAVGASEAALMTAELTPAEKDQVVQFIAFLRAKRKSQA